MSSIGSFWRELKPFHTELSKKIAEKWDKLCSVAAVWFRWNIMLWLINSIILCGSRTVGNNREIMIRLLSESTETNVKPGH